MKRLGVYTTIEAGLFLIGFALGIYVPTMGRPHSYYYEWNSVIIGFIGAAFLMFGVSVLLYLRKKRKVKYEDVI